MKNIFISLLFVLSTAYPQENFIFEQYSIEQGLSQSAVTSVLQDRYGFLWVGTMYGLNRFDGYNFLVYKPVIGDSNSLPTTPINSLAEDKAGNIWIGTNGGGIFRYDPLTNSFKKYVRDDRDRNLTVIMSIYVDSGNQIWAGTYTSGLLKYNPDKDNFSSFLSDINDPASIPSGIITAIYEDKGKNLWLGSTNAGLIQFERTKSLFKTFSVENGLASNWVTSITEDKKGNLVIGTNEGLSILSKERKFFNYYHDENNPGSISSNRINKVFTDREGKIFVGTNGAGISCLFPDENFFRISRTEDNNPYSISDNYIYSFYQDRSGLIWVGTNRGLNKIKDAKRFHIILGPQSKDRLGGKNIWSIAEDPDTNLWIGTDNGLIKINYNNKIIEKITGITPKGRLENKVVWALGIDKDENIWIGTNSGLSCLDKKNNKILNYYYLVNDSNYYNNIRGLYIDNDIVWIGTNFRGIIKFDISERKFSPFKPSSGDTELLNLSPVRKIYKDRSGIYWFGTAVGLYSYDPKSDALNLSIPSFDTQTKELNKLYNEGLSIIEHNNYLWIGTYGGGLIKFSPEKGIIKRYLEEDGLVDNIVYGIITDNSGNLWLGSGNGLAKFNPGNSTFINYDISDGLPSNEFNVNASLKSVTGKLYFGGINGLVSFYPEEIKIHQYIPPIAITNFKVFDKPFFKKLNLDNGETIELSYSQNFFSFEFVALDYTEPAMNQFAYMLEGYDKGWIYSGQRRYAAYTNLDPGNYILKVKASNNDGLWNEKSFLVNIRITPPFYETLWAYIFYTFLTVISLFSVRRYEINKRKRKEEALLKEAEMREAHLRAEKAELQAKAAEAEKEIEKQHIRNRIASDLHDEIGSNLSSIVLLTSMISMSDNDNEKSIKNIHHAAKISADAIRDIVWFINPSSDQLDKLVAKMKETANNMLPGIDLNFITEGLKDFDKLNPEIKRNIYLIYKEILNNIIKHSQATRVDIVVKEINKCFILWIRDNGIGFNEKTIRSGNGLINLKSRANQISGKINIISKEMEGTEISVEVKIT